MPNAPLQHVSTLGIGKNSFHLIGLDVRGAIVLRQKLSRGQVEARLANMPACLIGIGACVCAHHLSRQLLALGHVVKLIPVQFVKPFRKSHKRYHDGHGGVGTDLGGGHGSNSGLGSSGSSSGN